MAARRAVLSVGSFLLALVFWPGSGAGDEPIKVGGTGPRCGRWSSRERRSTA